MAATESPGKKALRYAEDELGVHKVHADALAARATLDKVLTDLSVLRDKRRALEMHLSDQEMVIAADERGKHPDMSAAGMEKHMKIALANSDAVREMREQIVKVTNDIEGLEYDRVVAETDIKIAVARLHELGGYFQYLAAIKTQAGKA